MSVSVIKRYECVAIDDGSFFLSSLLFYKVALGRETISSFLSFLCSALLLTELKVTGFFSFCDCFCLPRLHDKWGPDGDIMT